MLIYITINTNCRNNVLENAIDGETLKILIGDIDEFKAVLPKSGHRIQLKLAVSSAGASAVVKNKACSEENVSLHNFCINL